MVKLVMQKEEIRKKIRKIQNEKFKEDPMQFSLNSKIILGKVEKIINEKRPEKVFLYIEKKGEVEIFSISKKLLNDRVKVYIPYYNENKLYTPWGISELLMQDLKKDMVIKNAGVRQPADSEKIYEKVNEISFKKNDICIIPGVAFSRKKERIGYGGGNYDRYLASSIAYKIGVCFDFQLFNELPIKTHDVLMNCIVTESFII